MPISFPGHSFGNAIFPALLKQDPRYFYKGTGSKKSRFFYAVANAVICKGDNGRWQPNYSSVLGSLAAGGLSNLYYPASSRNGVGLTFENTLDRDRRKRDGRSGGGVFLKKAHTSRTRSAGPIGIPAGTR